MSIVIFLVAGLIAAPAFARAEDKSELQKRMREAEQVLKMSVTAPDKGIPKELLERAECVGVFPGVAKGAFVVGGEFGRGVFTCRGRDGAMGPPAFFSIGGPSVGWQFGGNVADFVLLIMNENGVKHLLQDHFTLGGEVSAVAGPVGRTVQAATDLQLHAEILSWSRSRGLFLGASLKGTVINHDEKAARLFYGREVPAREILVDHAVPVPAAAQGYVKAVTQYSKRAS